MEFAEAEEARINGKHASRNKWIKPKAARKRFYSLLQSARAHVIVTVRLNRVVDMDSKPAKEIMKAECDKNLPYMMDLSVQLEPAPDHKATYIKVPKPLHPYVANGERIAIEHGKRLAQENDSKPKQSAAAQDLDQLIAEMERITEDGMDAFRSAWTAAWQSTPKGSEKRAHMAKHQERLIALAIEADSQTSNDDPFGEEQQPEDGDVFPGDQI